MGDLSACSITVPKFPFKHTGVDLFSPYLIKIGRSDGVFCLFVWLLEHVILKLYLTCLLAYLFNIFGVLPFVGECVVDACFLTRI